MDQFLIDYTALIDEAMHNVVRKSLKMLEKNNNHGGHHFFISFFTRTPGVVLSDDLRKKYPKEMTIVLQYQFNDLVVGDSGFSVSLSFNGARENISIPYSALTAFSDPSVNFSIAFAGVRDEGRAPKEPEEPVVHRLYVAEDGGTMTLDEAKETQELNSNVVFIDKFRKDKKK